MKKTLVTILGLVALSMLAGCGSSAPKDQGTAEDKAAAASQGPATPPPPAAATPQGDPATGTGSAGIRSVPPTQEGDRN